MRKAVLLNDTSWINHHGCRLVVRNLEAGLRSIGVAVVATNRVGRPWAENAPFRRAMAGADVVIVNGEGTLHHGAARGLDLLQVADAPERRGKPIVLVNALFQENPADWASHLRRFDAVFVRDPLSAQTLDRDFDIAAGLTPDFSLYGAPDVAVSTADGPVAFGDSVFPEVTRALRAACAARPDARYLPIRTSLKHRQFRDWPLANRIYNLPSLTRETVTGWRDPQLVVTATAEAFEQRLQAMSLYVTGRFHALCLAARQRVPFVAIASNSHKNEALLAQIGLAPERSVELARVPRIDAATWAFQAYEIDALERFVARGRQQFDALFRTVAGLL